MSLPQVRHRLKEEVSEKPKMRILLFWVLFSALAITAIKTVLRPKHLHLGEVLDFLQGTLPNFFAGGLFCALGFVYYSALNRQHAPRWKRIMVACVCSFAGLTLWEYIQYFMGFPIDYFDILMTFGGNMFTVGIILLFGIS